MVTAENLLLKLSARDRRTINSGIKDYEKMIDKWQSNKPLVERVERAKKVKDIYKNQMSRKITKLFREHKLINNIEHKKALLSLNKDYRH